MPETFQSAYTFDLSQWPVVVAHGPSHVSESTIDDYFVEWSKLRERRRNFCLITDLQNMPFIDGHMLAVMSHKFRASQLELAEFTLAHALVSPAGSLVRGTVNVMTALLSIPFPFKIFGAVPDAQAWCQQYLVKKGESWKHV